MAFVVEDGTGLTTSNSYVSVAEFKAYWAERDFDFSSYSDGAIEVALVKSTDYIELQYRNRFIGCVLVADQALSFPRVGVYVRGIAVEGVPLSLKKAMFEYGKRTLPDDFELLPDPAETDKTGQIIEEAKIKVGPISKDIKYASIGAASSIRYPSADGWLSDLICSGGGVIRN